MTILFDTRRYGACLKAGQKHACLSNDAVAMVLRIPKSDWRTYARGSVPIPDDILIRIIDAGLSFMACRYRNCPSVIDRRKKKTPNYVGV